MFLTRMQRRQTMDTEVAKLNSSIQQFGLEHFKPKNKDRLTTLPAELHNRIYDLVMPRGYVWSSVLDNRGFKPRFYPGRTTPNICRISRLLRHECLAMRGAFNAFEIKSEQEYEDLSKQLSALVETGFRSVQHLVWEFSWTVPYEKISQREAVGFPELWKASKAKGKAMLDMVEHLLDRKLTEGGERWEWKSNHPDGNLPPVADSEDLAVPARVVFGQQRYEQSPVYRAYG